MAASPAALDTQARLDAFVARVQAETRVPGIGLAVSVDGKRFEACAGSAAMGARNPLTRDTRFQVGCAGKLLIAIATVELEQRAELDCAAPIATYLPELRGAWHGERVCVGHLLSHTSGYRGTNVLDPRMHALDWQTLVEYVRAAPRHFMPGTVFSYEHTEAVLLGEILQRVARVPLETLVEREALERLDIRVSLNRDDDGAHRAGRHRFDEAANAFVALDAPPMPQLWHAAFSERRMPLTDLVTVGEALSGSALTASRIGLSELTARRLRSAVVRIPAAAGGPLSELLPVRFGLGVAELRGGSHGSTGVSAGQCVGLRFDEQSGVAAAVGLTAMVPYLRDFMLSTVIADLSGRRASEAHEPFGFDLAELEGEYLGPGDGVVRVRCESGRLLCSIGRETSRERIDAELAVDDDGRPLLRSPLPQLSIGFFRCEHDGAGHDDIGLMVGLGAYKRRSTNRPFHK